MAKDGDFIRDFAARCQQKIEEFENTKVCCGLIGHSGSGKSSLINAIAGERIAAVGVVETTSDPQEYVHKGITFVDLPGCGTQKWPKDRYIEKLGLAEFDCFLLVTAQRLYENDIYLYRALIAMGKPCFVVRNMVDRAIEDGDYDNGLSEEDTKRIIVEDIRSQLVPDSPGFIYLTSARHPARYDLKVLLADISTSLEGLKRERFVADMAAYSKQALGKKRQVANERIPLYAGLAAANGINPIPGLDVSADIGILIRLGSEVANIYGLTSNQFAFVKRLLGSNALPSLLSKITQFATKYLAREGVFALLRQIAKQEAARQVTKYVPFVGPLIAAGIGWQATFIFGEQLVAEAEQLAADILREIIDISDDDL